MHRVCDVCGEGYEAKRPNSKYCGDKCRKRAQRGAPTEHADPVPLRPAEPVEAGPVESATLRDLSAAGRAETPLGLAAVALARRLDAGRDTGTAMASLAKQLEATLATALDGVTAAADPLDELRARRDAKRNAG